MVAASTRADTPGPAAPCDDCVRSLPTKGAPDADALVSFDPQCGAARRLRADGLRNLRQKPDQETQAIIDQRLVGMPMGDFIDGFGRPHNRSEQLDGTTAYFWVSKLAGAPNGFAPLDNAICSLSIVADARGRIVSAQVVLDDPGQTTASRCEALFKKK